MLQFLLPLDFTSDYSGLDDHMDYKRTAFGYPIPHLNARASNHITIEIINNAMNICDNFKEMARLVKQLMLENDVNSRSCQIGIKAFLQAFSALSMEEQFAILTSDLSLFRDVKEIVCLAELSGEKQTQQQKATFGSFLNKINIFGKQKVDTEAVPADLNVDFASILQDNQLLANHVSSDMTSLDNINFGFIDINGEREWEFQ